ncbi:MAG: DUF389 domain-containing protein [Verrucomicrobiales bacterium]|nr:DUF389 domain-containing protein [Verrucomicrobiales bacterium]
MSVVTVIHSREEAEGLIRWSLLLALSYEDERLTVLHSSGIKDSEVRAHVEEWEKDHPAVPEIEAKSLSAVPDEEEILDELRKPFVKFAVLGQNREMIHDRELIRLNRRIFDRAVCDTILFRLAGGRMNECDSVLIPSAGGPHSAVALRLGSRFANRFDGFVTPLYVEPEIGDDDGRAVGGRVLGRVISDAGVDTSDEEHIRPEVVVANDVGDGIYEAAHRHNYDLILIGASSSLSVKRKLFGAIPSRMLEGEDSTTVAVIRKRYPVVHRVRDAFERFFRLRVPQLEREDRIALFDRLQTQSRWSFDFFTLMLLSTGIASLGLMQDSPAVVIGAMLVAPLMTPLLGSGLALVQGNLPLMRTCLRSIFRGFLAAILVGGFLGWIGPLEEISRELAGRGNPTLLDFGVAALSGLAASYCVARPGLSSALAGVAIAAALVPPIATVGISLVLQDWDNAQGAALLFATNVVAIIIAASFTFFVIGVRGQVGKKQLWARRSLVLLLIMLVILMVPLATVLLKKAAG